jgi:hypothetical protein
MTRPTTYVIRMVLFLLAVAVVVWFIAPVLVGAFGNNRLLNGLILGVLALGIVWNFVQVLRLSPEVRWIEMLRQPRAGLAPPPAPRLLAPMASMLAARDREQRLVLSTPAARSLLDSLASRLDESRELSRYMTGLLIFLGLLGTFYGLILTVGSVGDVIASMSLGNGDAPAMFDQLKHGLARPLHGMGTAFSGSMFGLAGALVLGFLDLTAGQAQNRFFNELEEWLAGITRFGGAGGDGETAVPARLEGLLAQTSASLDELQTLVARGEDKQARVGEALVELAAHMGGLAEMIRANQLALNRLADVQETDLQRAHLRGIEQLLTRLVSETEHGREQSTAEIRQELRMLGRAIGREPPA